MPGQGSQHLGVVPGERASQDGVSVPGHIAIIPDGNRRWGDREGLPRAAAYERSERVVYATVEACLKLGVEWVTFFIFSTDNWKRERPEVEHLVAGNDSLLYRMTKTRAAELHARNIRCRVMGELTRVAPDAAAAVREVEALTANNTAMTLVMAVDYGGRQELVRAVRLALERNHNGAEFSVEHLRRLLYVPDMPDIDLVIRTSGERRLSNYMLWQMAYAEIMFIDVLWPDFNRSHLDQCIAAYSSTSRRFGR